MRWTKTIKKTLNPVWNADEVTWPDIEEDVSTLSLKITVFDSDTFGKETLGTFTVPLTLFVGDEHIFKSLPLEKTNKMKFEASGAVHFKCQVQDDNADATSTGSTAPRLPTYRWRTQLSSPIGPNRVNRALLTQRGPIWRLS